MPGDQSQNTSFATPDLELEWRDAPAGCAAAAMPEAARRLTALSAAVDATSLPGRRRCAERSSSLATALELSPRVLMYELLIAFLQSLDAIAATRR